MPPVPGPKVPSAAVVSFGSTPSMRLPGPTSGKPPAVGIIARKYSRLTPVVGFKVATARYQLPNCSDVSTSLSPLAVPKARLADLVSQTAT
jgi:hypothetical protein